jgi:hypothetical protein
MQRMLPARIRADNSDKAQVLGCDSLTPSRWPGDAA